MKRLCYLYVSNGSADVNQIPKWDPNAQTQESFAYHFQDEGFCYLFKQLLENKIFDEILVVIESNRSPGSMPIAPNMRILVVPHINELKPFLRDDDIMWARGGWRSWFPFLQEWHDQGRWLLFYRAASNRGAWEFWDIVLDDLILKCEQDQRGRFYFPINKPTNPAVFFPTNTLRIFDLMIGASHIHEKKGQFKIIPILLEYRRYFNKDLQCIMPGSFKRGLVTSTILGNIESEKLNIRTPGMVSRETLNDFYNQSKLFIHLGGAGQNDRGPLEAMCCGTPVMLSMEQYHAPLITYNHTSLSFHVDPDDHWGAAKEIHLALGKIDESFRKSVLNYYNKIDESIYPRFAMLFSKILTTPHNLRQTWFDDLLRGQR